jgi:hypothetical protein
MRAGEVMSEAWDAYRAHWGHLIPIAFVVYVLISLLELLLVVLLGWVGFAIGLLIGLAGIFWLQGALVVAIADVRDGRADLSLTETLARVRPRLNTLTLAGLLATIAVAVGFILLIVPGLVVLTFLLVIVPVIMLENAGVSRSFSRSTELVRGHAWSVFAVLALTILVLVLVSILVGLLGEGFDSRLASTVLDIAAQTVTAPFVALAWTTTYYRLRTLEAPAPTAA